MNEFEVMTEEELFSFDFVAGFTSGGAPYGITFEEAEELELEKKQTDKVRDYPF